MSNTLPCYPALLGKRVDGRFVADCLFSGSACGVCSLCGRSDAGISFTLQTFGPVLIFTAQSLGPVLTDLYCTKLLWLYSELCESHRTHNTCHCSSHILLTLSARTSIVKLQLFASPIHFPTIHCSCHFQHFFLFISQHISPDLNVAHCGVSR